MAEFSEVDATMLTPTDLSTTLSMTLDSSRSRSSNCRDRLDVTRCVTQPCNHRKRCMILLTLRDELEKRQLLHNVELLKLELSQKQLVIDTAHNEQASELEELRELLADAQHEKKLLSLRVQSLSHGYEQELKRAREQLQEERARVAMEGVAQRESEVEVAVIREEVEASLGVGLIPDDAQYRHLNSADSASLSIKDFIRLRMYEFANPLQKQLRDLQEAIGELNQQLARKDEEYTVMEQVRI